MGLEIGLSHPDAWDLDPLTLVSFDDDDAYYWFLEPLFQKLSEKTDQYIGMYGAAWFEEAVVTSLRDVVAEAKRLVASQPDAWDVRIGRSAGTPSEPVDPPVPIYRTVRKAEFNDLLDRFERLVAESLRTGIPIAAEADEPPRPR